MDRIVGKIALAVTVSCFLSVQSAVNLEITSVDGMQIERAYAGEPFLLNVAYSGVSSTATEPEIKGLQDFYVKRIGYQLQSVNRVATVVYTYQVRIDKPGTYLLGPAYDPDSTQKSSKIKLRVAASGTPVSQRARPQQSGAKQEAPGTVLFRFFVDKEKVVVGQKVKGLLRFYFKESEPLSVEQVVSNEPATITFGEKVGPKKGVQEVNGKRYAYMELSWDMYPQKLGKIVIPAYLVDYIIQQPTDRLLGPFAAFFGPSYERKRAYSNAITLEVSPLPETDTPVHAVGTFDRFHAEIEPAVAKQYEGMVMRLSIEGEGNLETVPAPELDNLPQEFKWYASKSSLEPLTRGQKKTFEYIVQGCKEGDWELPPQTFFYYDTHAGAYKTVKTSPLFVTILAGKAPVASEKREKKTVMPDKQTKQKQQVPALPINEVGPWARVYVQRTLPWSLFFLLLLLPLLFVIAQLMRRRSMAMLDRLMPHLKRRRAFARARQQLIKAEKEQNVSQLYAIFMQLFATRMGVELVTLSTEQIDQLIAEQQWFQKQKQAWQTFFDSIAASRFAAAAADRQALFGQAAHWLKELQGIL